MRKISKQNTHHNVNSRLSGTPIQLKEGYSKLKLETINEMITDDTGLIHGGFIFSMADYSAMLAVNHPNVVLGASNAKFLKPAVVGDVLFAEGHLRRREGKKILVDVTIKREEDIIFTGEFTCFTPEKHVLKR